MNKHLKKTVIASLLGAMMLNGCANLHREPTPISIPTTKDSIATATDLTNQSELSLDAGFEYSSGFELNQLEPNDPLPKKHVDQLSLNEQSVNQAIMMLAQGTGLTVTIQGGKDAIERYGSISMSNVNGSFEDVLENLSRSIGFFYTVKKNLLKIQAEQQFVIEIPPALNDDNTAGISNTLQFLGARDVYLDRINRTMVFRANRVAYEKVSEYLKYIRENRSMLVYEINIFQVDLKDANETGIKWNKLSYDHIAADTIKNIAASPTTGAGLGIVLNTSHFNIDALIEFLQTQGSVKTVSSPRLALITGTKGSIRVGSQNTFVSKVGSNSNLGVNQLTTETKDLKTGLDLSLFGEMHDKTVYSRVALSISEIVRLTNFQALGTNLVLPEIADREIKTEIRARPGDMILLGGITIEKNSQDTSRGILDNFNNKSVTRSELVIAMKPKVVYFTGKKKADGAPLFAGPATTQGADTKTAVPVIPVSAPAASEPKSQSKQETEPSSPAIAEKHDASQVKQSTVVSLPLINLPPVPTPAGAANLAKESNPTLAPQVSRPPPAPHLTPVDASNKGDSIVSPAYSPTPASPKAEASAEDYATAAENAAREKEELNAMEDKE